MKLEDTFADELLMHFTRLIRERLESALTQSKAAEACALISDRQNAVRITLDIEQPLYEVTTLLGAASLINRFASQSE